MRTDPTIDRIRKIRHEISEECSHDTRKIIEYYMKYQQKYADRLMKRSIALKSGGYRREKEKIYPSGHKGSEIINAHNTLSK